jgi:aspartyl-tRNA(Asn)/glutamyl-tRNA(Gln) amidotransferase subunit C
VNISIENVSHISRLARLSLVSLEQHMFQKQLTSILEYVEKLNEIDTDDIAPTTHVVRLENVFRDDSERNSLSVEDALMNAPERAGNFYQVPKIID